VAILGMSGDPVKAQAAFKAKLSLNFPLLSDPSHKTIQRFGAWQKKHFMGRTFMGILRSSFLIGETGKIEEIWPLVKAKGHASEVLRVISKKQPAAMAATR
jgi:thioredoxin-dependent peroxiredoxin